MFISLKTHVSDTETFFVCFSHSFDIGNKKGHIPDLQILEVEK